MTEQWRAVPGWEGRYDVSDQGRLRSWVPYHGRSLPHLRALPVGDQGYPMASLRRDGKCVMRKVHVLVAAAFLGERPTGAEVRHLNGIKTDNHVGNLAYGTRSENTLDRVRHGEHVQANRSHCPQGHPYDEQNTRIVRVGGEFRHRACKTCEAEWQRRRRAKRSAA